MGEMNDALARLGSEDTLAALGEDLRETFEATKDAFCATVQLSGDRTQTIRPPLRDTRGDRALAQMQQSNAGEALTYEGTLGEGGMGLVRLALQHSMGRRIAVKTLKQGLPNTELSLRLLREAWITGSLEHPNVVPIYDVSVADDGRPVILMKNIEGASWATLMGDGASLRERVGGRDALESNLRVLLQVTNAVGLAHARSVLHRDIKPDNVMIGVHGEVYLVDWGIAVSVVPDPTGRLPLLTDAAQMAGTPCYMAPEMVSATMGHKVSVRSDIYLLGAVLHELVTGKPPHDHGDLRSVLASILLSKPQLPTDTDAELRHVIERAMAPNPDHRYATAAEFRQASETFLVHRDSNQVTDDAWARLLELERDIAPQASMVEDHTRKAHVAYGACRFGFAQALTLWPENPRAQEGRDRAATGMLEFLLANGEVAAAQTVLFDLPTPPAELASRVRTAVATAAAEARKGAMQLDTKTGGRTRLLAVVLVGVMWVSAPIAAQAVTLKGNLSHGRILGGQLTEAVFLACFVFWARDSLFKTPLNRRVVGSIAAVLLGSLCTEATIWALGLPVSASRVLLPTVWFTALLFTMVTVSIRLWPCALVAAAMVVVRALHPDLGNHATAIANLAFLGNLAFIWKDLTAAEITRLRALPAQQRDR